MANWGKLATGIPLIGGIFDDSEQQALDQLQQNKAIYAGLQVPNFEKYKPEDYQYVGDYNPEDVNFKATSEDPTLRNTQINVLNRMAGLADTGLSEVDQAGYERARELGDQMSRSGTEAALQNAQGRGVAGSGLEFALREAASQGGAGRALDAGLQQSADSARQRAMYEQMMGNYASGLRSQDFGVNQANTDIMNRMNQINTQAGNQAQQYNLGQRQQIMNANTQGHNQAQQYNNGLLQTQYQDQYQKAAGQAGANTGMAQGYAAQNAANQSDRNANTDFILKTMAMGKDLLKQGASGGAGEA